MKKTVAAAVAAAFVVGASANVSAAANPFSDVPAGHWAYNSVSKLAAEGIIEGYGDGTYRGDRNITRYEMAQMIAKAMAKNPTGANKAELDRLAAEFRDELDWACALPNLRNTPIKSFGRANFVIVITATRKTLEAAATKRKPKTSSKCASSRPQPSMTTGKSKLV